MIIDIEKLKSCDSFELKLSAHFLYEYAENVREYFMLLTEKTTSVRPADAIDVLSALVAFREYFADEATWERLTLRMLDIIRKGINKSLFNKIAVFSGMTHIAFSVHALSISTPKIRSFLERINEILLENLANYLKDADNEDFFTKGNYEVILGLSGPLRYLLDFCDDAKMKNMAQQIIAVFIRRSKDTTVLGKRVTGWHYYPSEIEESFMTKKTPNGVVNYGVSHGMAGPLATLSLAYGKGFRTEGLLDAINGLISEYMSALYYFDDIAFWPDRISYEQYVGLEEITKAPSRMSWCYGSVGILRVLYTAGSLLPDESVKAFALDELAKIAEMDLAKYELVQPVVCHGFVGTAAILNAMYLDTKRVEFLQKATEMVETSISFNIERYTENEDKLASILNLSSRASLHSHLEGYNGLIQTTLSIVKGRPNENEKRLLMI